MSLTLKFVTQIIKPFELLNKELTWQNSVDSNISDYITQAGNLAVQLSHFPEIAGQSVLRTNTSCKEFEIIVHVADEWKHNFKDNERDNKLQLGSQFEINSDDTQYRFIRNAITIEHVKYKSSKLDFIDTFIVASQFVIKKLMLNIVWRPERLEAIVKWCDSVSLDINFANQIAWGGMRLEILRKNSEGQLIHQDGFKNMPFILKEKIPIQATSYEDYVFQLLKRSINFAKEVVLKRSEIFQNTDQLDYNFMINYLPPNNRTSAIVKIIDKSYQVEELELLIKKLDQVNYEKLLLFSPQEFTEDIKNVAFQTNNKVYLINISKTDAGNIPLGFLSKRFAHNFIRLTSIKDIVIGVLKENEELNSKIIFTPNFLKEKIFSFDKSTLISLVEVCMSHVKPKDGQLHGHRKIKHNPRDNFELYYNIDNTFIRVSISASIEWEITSNHLTMPILTYEESSMGLSIWSLEGSGEIENKLMFPKYRVTKYGETSALGMI